MVTGNGVTITNKGAGATVNSGNPVWLVDARLTKQWQNDNKYDPVPGKFDVVEGRQLSFENPKITVEGFIDIHNTSGTHTINGDANCSKVNENLLIQLSALKQLSNSYLELKGWYGTNSTSTLGRNTTSGYPTVTTTGVRVMVDGYSLDIPSDSEDNHMWSFSMTLTETGVIS